MSIERAMRDEAMNELKEVGKMKLGSDEHIKTVGAVNSMVDRLSEYEKIANEKKRLEIEERKTLIEAARLENDKKDRAIKNGITIGTSVGFILVNVGTVIASMRFEQGYTHTTEAGKSSLRTLLNLWSKSK